MEAGTNTRNRSTAYVSVKFTPSLSTNILKPFSAISFQRTRYRISI